MFLLGISAYYHDSAAVILQDGQIIAAAQEERFSRIKHDSRFPIHSVQYCLDEAGIELGDVDAIAFYEKPFLKFERLLETYLAFAPRGLSSFIRSMQVWAGQKLFLKKIIREELKAIDPSAAKKIKFLFPDHHLSHAASSYFSSGYEHAALLVIDAVGESTTTSIFSASNGVITLKRKLSFPHSVGLLYSAFTYWLGFRVNSGEYKLMGLAPYGRKNSSEVEEMKQKILNYLCRVNEDGSIWLNQRWFNYTTGFTMANDKKWEKLFGFKRRQPVDPIRIHHANLALAIQEITETIVLKLCRHAADITSSDHLCMAGGVALNCVANSRVLESEIFKHVFVQPAAGDAGGALGAAQAAWHLFYEKPYHPKPDQPCFKNTFLGPSFSNEQILRTLNKNKLSFHWMDDQEIFDSTARLLNSGEVVGWFQGRMEFGPRALGNRSILADPRRADIQKILNQKIKFREGFRPFAPSVKEEKATEWFNINNPSPYMLFVHQLKNKYPLPEDFCDYPIERKLEFQKSILPAITHSDFSARVQTVSKDENILFWKLLDAFDKLTGCPVLVNTSFNVRGEPMVCSPEDAIACFLGSGMDVLVIGNYLLKKSEQSPQCISKFLNRNFDDD